jgi:hypothetical protein
VDRVGKRALELLRNKLLKGLRDDGCITTVFGVSLAASSGAGVVNLGILGRVITRHKLCEPCWGGSPQDPGVLSAGWCRAPWSHLWREKHPVLVRSAY